MEKPIARAPLECGETPLLALLFDVPSTNDAPDVTGIEETIRPKGKFCNGGIVATQYALELPANRVKEEDRPGSSMIASCRQKAAIERVSD